MKIPMSKESIQKLDSELSKLAVHGREVSVVIGIAREHGDIKENAEYHAAKDEQAFIVSRIGQLSEIRANSVELNTAHLNTDMVNFGARVTVLDENTDEETTYCIVSEYEADISKGFISHTSPIGRSLMRKEIGDLLTIKTPGGDKHYEILDIKYC